MSHRIVQGPSPKSPLAAVPILIAANPNGNNCHQFGQATCPFFPTRGGGRSLALASSASETSSGTSENDSSLDLEAIAKYFVALATQMGLLTALFTGLDFFVAKSSISRVPFAINWVFFYFLALKSRVFNPLSNRRPQPVTKEIEGAEQRKMPSWTPPGFIFPIVWLLLIGPLRAATSAMVYQKLGGVYANPAILSLMLHLSIGDIWNTINNVERRYGTSVLGVGCVWISAAFAARQYYNVLPLAGRLLSLKLIWLTIASSLITRTWQINPDSNTGKLSSLFPTKRDGPTKLVWFGSSDS